MHGLPSVIRMLSGWQIECLPGLDSGEKLSLKVDCLGDSSWVEFVLITMVHSVESVREIVGLSV